MDTEVTFTLSVEDAERLYDLANQNPTRTPIDGAVLAFVRVRIELAKRAATEAQVQAAMARVAELGDHIVGACEFLPNVEQANTEPGDQDYDAQDDPCADPVCGCTVRQFDPTEQDPT